MSQQDMFAMSPISAPNSKATSASLPGMQKTPSKDYHWLLTFHCSEDEEFPFSHYITSLFRGAVPTNWLRGKLREEWRMQERIMPNLPGESYKVFAKIQKGKNIIIIIISNYYYLKKQLQGQTPHALRLLLPCSMQTSEATSTKICLSRRLTIG